VKTDATDEEPFYIGYSPRAPARTVRCTRVIVAALALLASGGAALVAVTLPYFGTGVFNFGRAEVVRGVLLCDTAPRPVTADAEYLLVGYGKNGVAPEFCGTRDQQTVRLRGTMISRDGARLLEVTGPTEMVPAGGTLPTEAEPLGSLSLTGEIVDPKCYFGVMNPGEGRVHRACAVLCLRGGIPAVFVARDRSGARIPLLITGARGEPMHELLLPWVREPVQARGEAFRQGSWLVWRIDPATLAWAR
jgi:hypothetical protein